jgi:hypothetical protein
MQTSRLCMELNMHKECCHILETVVAMNDSEIEAWYLLAFCKCKLGKNKQALDCCKHVKVQCEKQKVTDQELKDGTEEIFMEVCKKLGKNPAEEINVAVGEGEDDGFETDSEGECSDSGEDVEMKD